MSGVTSFNPHKEEDEGYLAAEAGQSLSANVYPFGTIRYEHWRRGWRIRKEETARTVRLGQGDGQEDEGYLAAQMGKPVTENPYPPGTIRYEHWRRGWCIRTEQTQRAARFDRAIEF